MRKLRLHLRRLRVGILPLSAIGIVALGTTAILLALNGTPRAPKLKTGRGDVLYVAGNRNFSVNIGTKDGESKIGFSVGQARANFVLAGADHVVPNKETGTSVLFPQVTPNTDLRYTTTPTGLKEELIVHAKPEKNMFLFDLLLQNVTPKKRTNDFIDPTFKDSEGNYQFHFEKPFAVDAAGVRTDNVLLQIGEDKQVAGKYYMKLIVDEAWLADSDRSYPVMIDPTIVHDTTAEFATGQMNRVKDIGSGSSPLIETYYQELPSDQNTVGLWHMNETSDNTCTGGTNDICDSSGNSRDGAATGTTINTSTQRLGSASRTFNGTSDFISAGSNPITGTNPFTLEAWMNPTGQSDYGLGVYIGNAAAGNAAYIGYVTTATTGTSNSIGGGFYGTNYGSGVIQDTGWHHVAMTFSGGSSGTVVLYVDGRETLRTTATPSLSSTAITIGKANSGTTYYYKGGIDDVRISNIARSPEEIKASASRSPYSVLTSDVIDLTNVTSWNPLTWTELGVATGDGETLKDSTSLVAQWNLNETSGTTADNAEGTASRDLTLSGFDSTASQDADPDSSWTANNKRWGAGALKFDGTDSYASCTDANCGGTSALDIGTRNWTVGYWVKSNGDTSKTLVSKGTTNDYSWILDINSTGQAGWALFQAGGSSTYITTLSSMPINDGFWHYIVGTWDPATTTLSLYIDGKLDQTTTSTSGSFNNNSAANFEIGRRADGTRYFSGVLDAISVYARTLSANEILSNYQAGNIEFQTRVGADTSPDDGSWETWKPTTDETTIESFDTNPVQDYYTTTLIHSDGTDTSTFFPDSSLYPKTFTANGNAQIDTAQGVFGGASGLYDGTGDYLSTSDSDDWQLDAGSNSNKWTIDFWVRFNGDPGGGNAGFIQQRVDNNNHWYLSYSGNPSPVLRWRLRSGGSDIAAIDLPWDPATNTWYHVAFVKNGSSGYMGFIDGTQVGSTTVDTDTIPNFAGGLVTGNMIDPFGTNYYLNGWMDEIRITKGVARWTSNFTPPSSAYDNLTHIETSTDSNIKIEQSGSEKLINGRSKIDGNTVGLWHLEETGGTGAYIKDVSGNANNGTPTGTTVVNGISGKARSFNGTSDYINAGTASWSSIPTDFTISGWIKVNPDSNYRYFFSKDSSSTYNTTNPHILFGLSSGNRLAIRAGGGGAELNTGNGAGVNSGSYPVNTWIHVAATKSGSTFKFYLNGVLSDTQTAAVSGTIGNAFLLGKNTGNNYWNSYIDELKITNNTASDEEIAESYRMGRDHYINKTISSTDLSGKSSLPFYVAGDRPGSYLSATVGESAYANYQPDTSTKGLWHLDEQSGTTNTYLKDSSGNGFHSSAIANITSIQGAVGKGISFNGSSSYVDLSVTTPTLPFTIEMWANPTTSTPVGMFDSASGQANVIRNYSAGNVEWWNGTPSVALNMTANQWQHLVFVISHDGTNRKIDYYKNGVLQTSASAVGSSTFAWTTFTLGNINDGGAGWYSGKLDEVRISNGARSASEIRQAYEVGLRTHPITIDFGASLDSGNLISGSGDTSFTVDATLKGLNSKGSNIYLGDKIIVRENYDGTEYIAQGDVTGVTVSTGAITVSAWDSGSTFPSGGFTASADVFKWQREYWNIDGEVLDSHINAVTNLSLRLTNGSEGRTIWLDDLKSNGSYLTTPSGSTVTSSTGNRYLQYRAIFSSADEAVSPTLSSVTINYASNTVPTTPTLDAPTDTATNQSLTPSLQTTATDSESDYLRYKIELCTNVGMTTDCQTFDQTSSQTGWSGQNAQTSTAYTSGTQATYTIQTPLSASTTYYWRSYAIDPGGSNTFSTTQGTPYAFTTSAAPTAPTTPYTESATNPSNVIDLTPEFSAIHNDADGDAANYSEIEVNTASDFSGTVMWDSGQISMTSTADGVRSPDVSYAGTTLTFTGTTYYWRIRFTDVNGAVGAWSATQNFTLNTPPGTPSLDLPLNGAIDVVPTAALATTATDADSDYLRYKIELCTNVGMTTDCQTFDQTSSQTGWSGQNAQTSTAYTSGTQATYTIQTPLSASTTYYWRSYAIDPAGANTWSSTQSTPFSFTTMNAPESANNCRINENNTDTAATIVWTDVSAAEDRYEVQRSVDGGAFAVLATNLAASTTSYTDSTVTQGHTYRYRVSPYFLGPTYGEWCTTSTITLESGTFQFNGLNLNGLKIN